MRGWERRSFGRSVRFASTAIFASLLAGCGGGGVGGPTPTPPPTASVTSVAVSCASATVNVGQTSQCSATVQGTGNYSSAVTWAI
ncbi:MAG: Ig-like domain-containing protein [Candidatus Saccharimonadales bacterium]